MLGVFTDEVWRDKETVRTEVLMQVECVSGDTGGPMAIRHDPVARLDKS